MQDSEDDDDDESPSAPEVVLVTNDRGNRDAARKAGEKAMPSRALCSGLITLARAMPCRALFARIHARCSVAAARDSRTGQQRTRT